MFTNFPLLEVNPQLEQKDGIYQDNKEFFRDTKLSNYIQMAVDEAFSKSSSKSLFSKDLEALSDTNELKSALNSAPYAFMREINFEHVNHCLDLTQDFGGVTHFLASKCALVESVKLDPGICRLADVRCVSKENVLNVSEDLDKLSFPASVYDLIVIGKLESLNLPEDQVSPFLAKLRAALKPNGALILGAKNSNRISKTFNVGQSELKYKDLYESENSGDELQSLSRLELRNLLLGSGYPKSQINAVFSPSDDCLTLFSENYLTSAVDGLNHFYRCGLFDNPDISEYLYFQRLVREKANLVDLATRYVVVAGATEEQVCKLYNNDFSHFPGIGRKHAWRTVTRRQREAQQVEKYSAYPEEEPDSSLVSQNLEPQPFYKGHLLVGDWLNALLEQDSNKFESLISEYHRYLSELNKSSKLSDYAYDLLPFNIVVNGRSGTYQTIDVEWQISQDISVDFILFRALFWFAFTNKTLLSHFAEEHNLYSIGTFVLRFLPSAHRIEDLNEHIELEELIQSQIDNNFSANAVSLSMLQPFGSESVSEKDLELQVAWSDLNKNVDMKHAVIKYWPRQKGPQTITIDLPSRPAKEFGLLRVDPMSEPGALAAVSVSISDEAGNNVWDSTAGDAHESHQMLDSDGIVVSTGDDPYWLFDLSDIQDNQLVKLSIELDWIWDKRYSSALNALTEANSKMVSDLIGQASRLNQYLATIDTQEIHIDSLINHRDSLTKIIQKKDETIDRFQRGHFVDRIHHLEEQLHHQHIRNGELHRFLLMRPSTRFARVMRRIIDKLLRRSPAPEVVEETEVEEVEQPKKQDPAANNGELLGQNLEDYDLWVSENSMTPDEIEAAKAEIEAMPTKPVFSILVPIYNTDPEYLLPMIESVRKQIYPYWQLCLVDDSSPKSYLKRILEHEALQDDRICVQLNDVNQGISVTTNDALKLATGDYIALLDHDDELSIDALYHNAKVINESPEVGLIYSDEDKMDMEGGRLEPFFKPDYSPDLLDTNNYICHFTVIKKSIMDDMGGFREGLDGSQDHDVILRAAAAAEKIVHIPKILYHWRKIPGSTAVVYDSKSYAWEAGRRAVEDVLKKREDGLRVDFGSLKGTYRVFREIKGEPLISIVIPFKDKPELLESCLDSILNRTSYSNFEIVGVSNNSESDATFERMAHYSELDSRVRFEEFNHPFNFSAICNYGVGKAKGEYIVLLNNDIEILTPDWIERMLEHAQRDEIGAVGCKLLYPDGRIQHAGVVAGMLGAAGHPHKFFPDNHIGYHGRLHMVYNVSAVTGAMMMMSKAKFDEVGGLDEEKFAVAYNDVDLCLKLLDSGYLNLFTPHASATHHESVSRGYEDTEEKVQRLKGEQNAFNNKWKDFLAKGDPFYNPNLSLKNERFSLNFKE